MELSPATTLPFGTRRDQIPDVLITDILSRLPIGPCIVRFRCVSKSWCDFLSDPSFIPKNLSSSSSDHQFMIRRTENRLRVVHSLHSPNTLEPLLPSPLQLPFNPDKVRRAGSHPDVSVVGCCNGLFCIIEYHRKERADLIIWNPATSQFKVIPPSSLDLPSDVSVGAIGFGFDPETNDYKIVRPLYRTMCCFQCHYCLEIYNSRNDSWTKFEEFPSLGSKVPQWRKGKLYWWRLSGQSLVFESFDMGREVFEKVEVACPPCSEYSYDTPECVLKEESMVAVFPDQYYDSDDDDFVESKRNNRCWEIWVLLKYWVAESWTKLYVVTNPAELTIVYCAGISRNLGTFFFAAFRSDLMDEKGDYWGEHGLATFELETGKFTDSEIQGTWFQVVTNYVPSQVSLQ